MPPGILTLVVWAESPRVADHASAFVAGVTLPCLQDGGATLFFASAGLDAADHVVKVGLRHLDGGVVNSEHPHDTC